VFRSKLAITDFDLHITSLPNSDHNIATLTALPFWVRLAW